MLHSTPRYVEEASKSEYNLQKEAKQVKEKNAIRWRA